MYHTKYVQKLFLFLLRRIVGHITFPLPVISSACMTVIQHIIECNVYANHLFICQCCMMFTHKLLLCILFRIDCPINSGLLSFLHFTTLDCPKGRNIVWNYFAMQDYCIVDRNNVDRIKMFYFVGCRTQSFVIEIKINSQG